MSHDYHEAMKLDNQVCFPLYAAAITLRINIKRSAHSSMVPGYAAAV